MKKKKKRRREEVEVLMKCSSSVHQVFKEVEEVEAGAEKPGAAGKAGEGDEESVKEGKGSVVHQTDSSCFHGCFCFTPEVPDGAAMSSDK